ISRTLRTMQISQAPFFSPERHSAQPLSSPSAQLPFSAGFNHARLLGALIGDRPQEFIKQQSRFSRFASEGNMTLKLLTIGEILWDVFDDFETLGGAPLNFSIAAQRLGNQV